MKLSVSDELTFHAYIIQAAALASAEHFYSQVGGKRAATRLGKSARKRVRRSVEEIYHCLGPIEWANERMSERTSANELTS
jgi:hypothetical protein